MKGITISLKEMKQLNIKRRRFRPDLNYTIRPGEVVREQPLDLPQGAPNR